MDVLGFMWLAVITGVGGGTVRDRGRRVNA
jgi:uncharacterized membrane protein YeiH